MRGAGGFTAKVWKTVIDETVGYVYAILLFPLIGHEQDKA